jgi:hypothetical protein
MDSRPAESDGVVLQEFLEQLRHFISPTYLEDQILGRHREMKDDGTLILSTLAWVGELAVQVHTLNRCGVHELLLDDAASRRQNVLVTTVTFAAPYPCFRHLNQ